MRSTIVAIAVCVLAASPGLDGEARVGAQTNPRSVLALGEAGITTSLATRHPSSFGTLLGVRLNAAIDNDRNGAHRIPLIAGVLGIVPGLGHLYAGEPVRALLVSGVWFGSGLVAFSSSNTTVTGLGGVVLIGTSVFSVVDAVRAADRFNRRHARLAVGGMR
jgi:hypothetical protein